MKNDLQKIKNDLLQKRLFSFLNSTSGLVHNLSNPLTIISTRSQLLQLRMPENQDFKKMVEQSKAIETILNNMVFISQNLPKDDITSLDINSLVKNEIEFHKAIAFFKHDVSKTFQYYPGPLTTISSYFHISTLFYCIIQLILNDLKDAQDKKIDISTNKLSDNIEIKIVASVPIRPEMNDDISKTGSNDLVQNILDACLLAKDQDISLDIKGNISATEFRILIPDKQ